MANSSSLTDYIEERNSEPHANPIWMREVTFVVEADGGATELSHTVVVNGMLRNMTIEVGAANGITGTINLDVDDINSVALDTNNTLAEGSGTLVSFNSGVGIPVNNFILRCDPSDDPTAGSDDWEIVVTCRGD